MVQDDIEPYFWDTYFWPFEEEKPEEKNMINRELLIEDDLIEPYEKPKTTLESFFLDRIYPLKKDIEELRKEINVRFKLNYHFLEEIQQQILTAETSLKEFRFWGVGYNTGVDVKRNHIERILSNLKTERRRLKLRCWEDLISLRKELRKKQDEYSLAKSREKIVKMSNTG